MPNLDIQFPPKAQVLFDKQYRYVTLYGGRGSAKSHSVARYLLLSGLQEPLRVMCGRETLLSLSESVHFLLKSLIEQYELHAFYDVQRDRIVGKRNGTEFIYAGLRTDPQKIKSTEGIDILWLEEAQTISEESLQLAIPTIRKPGSRVIFTLNPRFEDDPVWQNYVVNCPSNGIAVRMNLADNPFASPELLAERELCRVRQPHLFDHIWEGGMVSSSTMALWDWESVNGNRIAQSAEIQFGRVLVSVDPAVTANAKSDETGIVIVASSKSAPRHYYVLGDVSGRMAPEQWALRALQAYEYYQADAIVVEVNQGGDLVSGALANVCRAQGKTVPRIEEVRATRGKVLRAEPIAALYTQRLVHHVGSFPDLERQMMRFDPSDNRGKSPDRVDALVHGMVALSQGRQPMRVTSNAVSRLAQAFGRR